MKKSITISFKQALIFILLVHPGLWVVQPQSLFSCSSFAAARGGKVLTAHNFDMKNLDIKVWFVPPAKGKYGCFFFGLGVGYPLGGVNDQGLTIDSAGTPNVQLNNLPGKHTIHSKFEVIKLAGKILQSCATVDNVLALYKNYNLGNMDYHYIISDKTGKSVLVEAAPDGNVILLFPDKAIRFEADRASGEWVFKEPEHLPEHMNSRQKDFLALTNFLHTDPRRKGILGEFPCWRFDTIKKTLDSSTQISVSLFRSLLDRIHLEEDLPTKFSIIKDLKKGEIYIYYLHDFETEIKFNLREELNKGAHAYDLRELFKLRWHPFYLFCVLVFFSAVFFFPMGYFIQCKRKNHRLLGTSPTAKTKLLLPAWFIAAANSISLLIILYRYPYILSHRMEMVKNHLFVNFFYSHGTYFYISLVLTLLMLLFSVFTWIKKQWSQAERIHFSLVTLIDGMLF